VTTAFINQTMKQKKRRVKIERKIESGKNKKTSEIKKEEG